MEEAAYSELVAANLAAVRGRIAAAAQGAGRPADAVTLVAVSKTHPKRRCAPRSTPASASSARTGCRRHWQNFRSCAASFPISSCT